MADSIREPPRSRGDLMRRRAKEAEQLGDHALAQALRNAAKASDELDAALRGLVAR